MAFSYKVKAEFSIEMNGNEIFSLGYWSEIACLKKYFVSGRPGSCLSTSGTGTWSHCITQETLYLTIYMIDKFLESEGLTIKRNRLQLVGVAAMFTASKVTTYCLTKDKIKGTVVPIVDRIQIRYYCNHFKLCIIRRDRCAGAQFRELFWNFAWILDKIN